MLARRMCPITRIQKLFAHAAALGCRLDVKVAHVQINCCVYRLAALPRAFFWLLTLHSSARLTCQRAFWLLTHTLQSLQSDFSLLTHTFGPPGVCASLSARFRLSSPPRAISVFSMVTKNKTAFRPNLKVDGTLASILSVKLANPEPCHRFEPPQSVIETAKKATMEYNQLHCSKTSKH